MNDEPFLIQFLFEALDRLIASPPKTNKIDQIADSLVEQFILKDAKLDDLSSIQLLYIVVHFLPKPEWVLPYTLLNTMKICSKTRYTVSQEVRAKFHERFGTERFEVFAKIVRLSSLNKVFAQYAAEYAPYAAGVRTFDY